MDSIRTVRRRYEQFNTDDQLHLALRYGSDFHSFLLRNAELHKTTELTQSNNATHPIKQRNWLATKQASFAVGVALVQRIVTGMYRSAPSTLGEAE